MKREPLQFERKHLNTKLTGDLEIYKAYCCQVNKKIIEAKVEFNRKNISDCKQDKKKLFSLTNRMMGRKQQTILPKDVPDQTLADNLQSFSKIKLIRYARS